jgi:hypothetical protein
MLGFIPSDGDTPLFFFGKGGITVYILVYMDGIIVVGSSSTATNALLRNLEKDFALKDFGDMHYFLGIEVNKINDGILLSQSKYAMDILKRAGTTTSKPVNTPLFTSEKLSAQDGEGLGPVDSTSYQSLVGSLQYLTLTRPNLVFSVNKVYQYLHSPTTVHLQAAKHIFRYVRGTVDLGLHIVKFPFLLVSCLLDANWVGCLDDRRSTEGFAIFLGLKLVSWSAQK